MKHLLIPAICWMASITPGSAQDPQTERIQYWQQRLEKDRYHAFVMDLSSPNKPAWPDITRDSASEQQVLELLTTLRGKVLQETAEHNDRSAIAFVGATAFQKSKGLRNRIMADALMRIAISETTIGMWTPPQFRSGDEVSFQRKLCAAASPNLRSYLLQLSEHEPTLAGRRDAINALPETPSLAAALEAAGCDARPPFIRKSFTEALLQPDMRDLLIRFTETRRMAQISARSTVAFLEAGGVERELDPANHALFDNRMSVAAKYFQPPANGEAAVTQEEVRLMVLLRHSDSERVAFTRQTLE